MTSLVTICSLWPRLFPASSACCRWSWVLICSRSSLTFVTGRGSTARVVTIEPIKVNANRLLLLLILVLLLLLMLLLLMLLMLLLSSSAVIAITLNNWNVVSPCSFRSFLRRLLRRSACFSFRRRVSLRHSLQLCAGLYRTKAVQNMKDKRLKWRCSKLSCPLIS